MSAVRPLARLAWRDVRRRPVRTALIALLIAVPTTVILTINLVLSTTALTPAQNATLVMGRAQQLVTTSTADAPAFPTGAVVIERRAAVAQDKQGEFHTIEVRAGNVLDPLLVGKYELRNGRAAIGPAEVMVSTEFTRTWHIGVGDQLALGPQAQNFSVVGIVRDSGEVRAAAVYLEANSTIGFENWTDAFLPERSSQSFEGAYNGGQFATDAPYSSIGVTDRALIQIAMFVVLMLLGLLISAAFASGAKRQLREVGLASSNGANPVHIRRAFALQGTITAALGLAIGAGLVVASLLIWRDEFDRAMGRIRPLDVNVTDMLISIGAILFAGTFSAWIPARAVSRTPVLAALAGRRPLPPPRRRTPVAGLSILALGCVLISTGASSSRNSGSPEGSMFTILLGVAALIVGIAISSSWIVAAGGNGCARLGGVVRIVGRNMARHRTRTGPLVAAMAATGAATILAVTALNSERYKPQGIDTTQSFNMYGGTSVEVHNLVDSIIKIVPDTQVVTYLSPIFDGSSNEYPELRFAGLGVQIVDTTASNILEPEVVAALGRGELVSSRPVSKAVNHLATVALGTTDLSDGTFTPVHSIDVTVSDLKGTNPDPQLFGDVTMIDVSTAQRFGLGEDDLQTSVQLSSPTTWSSLQREQLIELSRRSYRDADLAYAMTGNRIAGARLYVYEPSTSNGIYRILMLAAIGVGALLILIAVGFGMSLSRVEQRDEDRLLQALGASPGTRRRAGAVEAAMLCGIAVAIAVPTGLALAMVIRRAAHGVATSVPWLAILGFSVALPLLAALFFGPLRRSPRRIELLH
jgi:putative ABC transport system permease protein